MPLSPFTNEEAETNRWTNLPRVARLLSGRCGIKSRLPTLYCFYYYYTIMLLFTIITIIKIAFVQCTEDTKVWPGWLRTSLCYQKHRFSEQRSHTALPSTGPRLHVAGRERRGENHEGPSPFVPCLPTFAYITQIVSPQRPVRDPFTLKKLSTWYRLSLDFSPEMKINLLLSFVHHIHIPSYFPMFTHFMEKQRSDRERVPLCLFHIFGINLRNVQKSVEKKSLHPFIRNNAATKCIFCPPVS